MPISDNDFLYNIGINTQKLSQNILEILKSAAYENTISVSSVDLSGLPVLEHGVSQNTAQIELSYSLLGTAISMGPRSLSSLDFLIGSILTCSSSILKPLMFSSSNPELVKKEYFQRIEHELQEQCQGKVERITENITLINAEIIHPSENPFSSTPRVLPNRFLRENLNKPGLCSIIKNYIFVTTNILHHHIETKFSVLLEGNVKRRSTKAMSCLNKP